MKRRIYIISICMSLLSSFAYAKEGDCVYSLSNGLSAYCSYIDAPEGTKRFLEVIYNHQMSITSCADNSTLPFSFNKDMIGNGNFIPIGSYELTFVQCDNITCNKNKVIGTSSFVISADKTVKPNKFSVPLDPAFGSACDPAQMNPDNMVFVVKKSECKNIPYCVNLSIKNKGSKFIKIISDQHTAITYCLSDKNDIALGPNVTVGQHTLNIYECDNAACDNQKLLGNIVLNVTADKKIDPGHDAPIVIDSAGQHCSTK